MPFEERKRYFDQKAKWIVDYAYKNSPRIEERLDKAGVSPSQINCVKGLEKIPVLHRAELIKLQRDEPPFGGFLAVFLGSLKRIFLYRANLQYFGNFRGAHANQSFPCCWI